MGIRRRGTSKAVLTLIAGLLVPIVGSAPALAVSNPHGKLLVLAGSGQYLAYADYQVTPAGDPDYAHGVLHVVQPNGVEAALGATPGAAAPDGPTGYRYSLVGPILTASATSDPSEVSWWDLTTATAGTATLPDGATWQGSSPDGWIIVDADHTTVADESTAGTVTSYGQPLPAEAQADGAIHATTGPYGVVSYAADGLLAYQTWAAPLTVVPLNGGAATATVGLTCGSMSTTTVGCSDDGADGQSPDNLAVPLDGGLLARYDGCGTGNVAVGNRLVEVCGTSARPRFAASGRLTWSGVPVLANPGVSAFGNFVTEGPEQQQIISLATAASAATVVVTIAVTPPATLARLDAANLRLAAAAVEAEALNSGALTSPTTTTLPAQILLASADALIKAATAADSSLRPRSTTAVMGVVPYNLSHRPARHPRHAHITTTRSLDRFTHALADRGAVGFGVHRLHGGAHPATFQKADGVFVDPHLPAPVRPTISMVALRAALSKLGQPYVWAAAGPATFDCSGLTQWAYAHAGVPLAHFTGDQWNEGANIAPRDILPGDLILFESPIGGREVIHHVSLYLGAGWMLNAPYTGQYVDVVPVPSGVAGVIRP
jgi:cell wall-associated NlpC family hydrolase